MPFFAAVKTNMGLDPRGANVYPSAGPYRIASRDIGRQVVLERNPFYRGSRPANADRIVYSVNIDSNQSLLQVRAGQVDYDASGLPPSAHDDLAKSFGVRKSGARRYFVNPRVGLQYLALNTARPALLRLSAREAVSFAIDRPALVRVAQVLQYNLSQVGWDVKLKPRPFAATLKTAGTKARSTTSTCTAGSPTTPIRSTSSTCCSTARGSRRRTASTSRTSRARYEA